MTHTHTHTHLTALCPGLPRWAGTRKVKPIWILLEQEILSGGGISWAICKSAPRSRKITTPTPHCLVFYRPDALPATQPTASEHWRQHVFVRDCYKFTTESNSERILKIGQYLVKLWARVRCLVFFDSRCTFYLFSSSCFACWHCALYHHLMSLSALILKLKGSLPSDSLQIIYHALILSKV